MEPQKLLEHLRGAHYVNVKIRKGGRDLEFEADWLRDLIESSIQNQPKDLLKNALWKALFIQGQDTLDRCYKSVMRTFGFTEDEILEFCDNLYEAECEREAAR